ncbi:unnamed protein product [Rotaria sp. Silwood2]|nr:unnamed protein product [Rotaria sp. Silwood2]
MYSASILFRLVVIFEFLSNFNVQLLCSIHDDEILCKAPEFYHYNSSSINNNNIIRSGQTLHLTNAYYSGMLIENINELIIDDYPYKTFPLPFISSLTLHKLHIEHTFLNVFPIWFCTKSHVHTLNDARATLKILTLVISICISRIPLIIFIFLALIVHPTYSYNINNYSFNFNHFKIVVLFLQPFSSCFNPFMYSSLSTLKWTRTRTDFERPKPMKRSFEFSRFRSTSVVFNRGYHPLRMMSISSLDYRLSSSPNTP